MGAVEDGQIVLFDSGSTALQVARSLRADIQITAVTAAPMTAIALSEYEGVKVILAGGQLNPRTMSSSGHEAVRMLAGIKKKRVAMLTGWATANHQRQWM